MVIAERTWKSASVAQATMFPGFSVSSFSSPVERVMRWASKTALLRLLMNAMHLVRGLHLQVHALHAGALERGQVAGFLRLQVGGEEVEVLVAVGVLQVEQVLAVERPVVLADAAFRVGGDGPVVGLAEGADPDLQDVLVVRPEVGEVLAVRGQLRAGPFRVAEQDLPRDQRRGFGGGSSGVPVRVPRAARTASSVTRIR